MYKVDESSKCWIWSKSVNPSGYGVAHVGRTSEAAHRKVYEDEVGPIPEGLELDHLCRNRACVNPGHLEPVTHAENVRRSMPFSRLLFGGCKNGHPLDGVRSRPEGGRYCKTCVKLSKQRQRAAKVSA